MPDGYGMCYGSLMTAARAKNVISIGLLTCCIWYARAGERGSKPGHLHSTTDCPAPASKPRGVHSISRTILLLLPCAGPAPSSAASAQGDGDHGHGRRGPHGKGTARSSEDASLQGRQPVRNLERTRQEGTLQQGGAGARGRSMGRGAEQSQPSTESR